MYKVHIFSTSLSASVQSKKIRSTLRMYDIVRHKKIEVMFNALIQQQYLLWLRPLHTAEKHRPTMFHTATVRPKRSGPSIRYNTP